MKKAILKGTEKQVAWAEDIRREFIDFTLGKDTSDEIREEVIEMMSENRRNLFLELMDVENAKWWIENREHLGFGIKHIAGRIKTGKMIIGK